MDPLPDKEFNLETSGNTPIEGDIIKEGVNDDLIKNILDEDATVKLLPEEEFNGSEDKLRKEELNRNAIRFDSRKWPKVGSIVRVPFVISASFDNREKHNITNAMKMIHKKTCIRFKNKNSLDRNSIHFYKGGGCYSRLGKIGGKQRLSLARGCGSGIGIGIGIVQHVIMHSLGFYHEHSRMIETNI